MKKYLPYLATLAAGLLLGWVFFGGSKPEESHDHSATDVAGETIWTCSMDPQVRMTEPGPCPICGMDLIPLSTLGSSTLSPDELEMTEVSLRMADIQTTVLQKADPERKLILTGKIKPDETRISQLTARFPGRIEQLFVNFTGQQVRQGQKLATVYSPELIAAQRELFEAISLRELSPGLYEAARRKLKLWDLTDAQIDALESAKEPSTSFDILAPRSGTVTQRHVAVGDYVQQGMPMIEVVDLSRLWVEFDAYEADLAWIKTGEEVTYSVASIPGKDFSGKVNFVSPLIDPQTRTASVRVPVTNSGGQLKPDMFVRGSLTANLPLKGEALLVPKSAVLWTGERAIVYVKQPNREEATFVTREITLGAETGAMYIVQEGLNAGEEVVSHGAFKVDAAAQIAGKPSMMNPKGSALAMAHQHGGKEPMETEVPEAFLRQLEAFLSGYFSLTDALIASDPTATQSAASAALNSLKQVDMTLLSAEMHIAWMKQLAVIRPALEAIADAEDLVAQRKTLSSLSNAIYHSLRSFGGASRLTYYQYCPMAINNQGAYWLSRKEEILNPYFGESMLRCGETRDIIQAKTN
ncbi:MAG: efflux RND transporter periplasmic adaptor subunit [Bacteroidia bacterium]|nr:efflux RND transporter periplasmic adaptor subunit [Bacteroidia bacterium]